VTIATTVAPMPNPITARRKKLLAITCRTGEAGCCNKVAIAHVENMYKPSSPASIRYSGQWKRKLPNAFTAFALIVPLPINPPASGWTREGVICLGSNISCHAGQRTRAREHLQDEGVRADKRSTAPRGRDIACIHVPQQSALLRRSAHTVPLQL